MKARSLEIVLHVLLILTCLVIINVPSVNLSFGVFSTGRYGFLWPSIIGTGINCLLFYGNAYFLIPVLLRLQKKVAYIASLSIGFGLLSAVEVIVDYVLAISAGIDVEARGGWSEIVVLVIVINLLTLLASFAYRFSKDWFYHEHIQRKLNEEKLAAELAFLKSQVNPHFLFNTLNNLFALAIQNKDEITAEGIRKLAGLMRYMLHESNKELIELSKELEYLTHYIELQKIRLLNQPGSRIQMNVLGNPELIQVAPMLFIPFIENAFKHGISMSNPSPISIQFNLSASEIHFSANNTINRLRKTEPDEISGVGLENVKKRLNLLYPNRHTLQIHTIDDQFTVTLIIHLN